MHHWSDVPRGLAEMRRVARKRVVLLTWDPGFDDALWLTLHYVPRIRERDRVVFPPLELLGAALGELRVSPVPITYDCSDGFLGAWWRRPEAVERLCRDLETGEWDRRFGYLRELEEIDLGYRLVVAELT